MVSEDRIRRLISGAKGGRREDAVGLLRTFQKQPSEASPELLAYLAECLKAWLSSDLRPGEADAAFNVRRERGRAANGASTASVEVEKRDADRFYHYLKARGAGQGRDDAIVYAANAANCSEATIKALVDPADHRQTRAYSAAQFRLLDEADD